MQHAERFNKTNAFIPKIYMSSGEFFAERKKFQQTVEGSQIRPHLLKRFEKAYLDAGINPYVSIVPNGSLHIDENVSALEVDFLHYIEARRENNPPNIMQVMKHFQITLPLISTWVGFFRDRKIRYRPMNGVTMLEFYFDGH